MKHLWQEFKNSSTIMKMTAVTVAAAWILVLMAFVAGVILLSERAGQAQSPSSDVTTPTISLEPASGMVKTPVTIRGQGWVPDSEILIYLLAADETAIPGYAIANATADPEGQFTVMVFIPTGPRWENTETVKVIARTSEGQAGAQALFNLISLPSLTTPIPITSTETPVTPLEPTITPTTALQEPPPAVQPGYPIATALTMVNIRSGPGTDYPVLGLLQTSQQAQITGVSLNGEWWQIKFSGATDERGWLSAKYVTVQNTDNMPVVQPDLLPPTPVPPTPTSGPVSVVITDWRGEYYNNLNLNGSPAVVRNDIAVNFDWGSGSPAVRINVDNFSARWTRSFNFPAGTYRFYVRVDDGARLWIDNNLVIDQWHDNSPTTYSADVTLTAGLHNLRMEYFERSGGAVAQLAWEWLEAYPDWKGEYFNNPNLGGMPVLVRNDPVLQFSWGPGSPGMGVPADNFSARWTRDLYFSAGTYRFKALVDDGVRLWLDNNLLIDRWRVGDPATFTADITLAEGMHNLKLEYFDYRYDAQMRLDWERLSVNYPDWKAEYYTNRKLDGNPALVRNELQINYNWGHGSPAAGIPADNFSARWTRKANFQSGVYLLRVKVDDGVRLWFDDVLVIDSWQDGGARTLEAERQISEGQHRLKVEYYERSGEARIEVSWQKKETPVNQLPQANPGGPYTVNEGSELTLDGRGSKDPDGAIAGYEWDFNHNGRDFVVNATGSTANVRYPDGPATIVVALRVTDNKGAGHTATTKVTVQNVAPTAMAGGPYTGLEGSLITLAGTATDPGLVDQTGLVYRWDFGDSSQGDGPVVSHSYAQAEIYQVKLTVTDKDGAQSVSNTTVQVTRGNQPPKAVIKGPTSGLIGTPLNFSGSGSSDPDGSIISYIWDFGDGSNGSGVNVSHSYNQSGDYIVTLTVTDNNGASASAVLTVRIDEPAPVNQPPQAIIAGPVSGVVTETLHFDGSGSFDPDGSIVSHAWNFGDDNSGSGPNVSHAYEAAGSYIISLTVTDNNGATVSTTWAVEITEPVEISSSSVQDTFRRQQ